MKISIKCPTISDDDSISHHFLLIDFRYTIQRKKDIQQFLWKFNTLAAMRLIMVLLLAFMAAGKLSSGSLLDKFRRFHTSAKVADSDNSVGKCECGKKQSVS